MIRVNLLGERRAVKKKLAITPAHRMAIGCTAILILTGSFIGWRYWSLAHQSSALDAELSNAQRETARLHSIIAQVQQFEQRKAQLQQRVGLIEQLRKDQTGPVHMLDQISRSLPPMLWLTELKQTANTAANEVLIDGRCTSLTGLSDFVANLEASGYFQKSIEIVSTTAETSAATGELIKFQIKATFKAPTDKPSAAPPAAVGGAPAARSGA